MASASGSGSQEPNNAECSETARKPNFASAFKNLKKSEFYEELPEVEKTNSVVDSNEQPQGSKPQKTLVSNCVIVNPKQRGNPIIKHIRNIPWEYGNIIPDYVMGATTCALFLSLRYHNLNPNYIHERLNSLGKQYELRVLLIQIDVNDPSYELKQLMKICLLADLTLLLAWCPEEAGRIIETYKMYEHKPPNMIMERQDSNPHSMLVDALTSIKSVNRTDALTLLSTFGSLEKIVNASVDELTLCPGLGPQKATRLHKVLRQSFKK